MGVTIRDAAYHLPDTVVTNEQLGEEHPDWDMTRVERRAGVRSRCLAADGETALDLAFTACRKLFAAHDGLPDRVDGLIFCTQSPDHIMPPNACLLHDRLDLPEHVLAFDINHACSGYVYGLALARALIASGTVTDVLLVNADTYSKYIHRDDRSARVLFGDAAAASWIGDSAGSNGLIDVLCATWGRHYRLFYVPAGGCRLPRSRETASPVVDDQGNVRTLDHVHMDGPGVLSFAMSRVPAQINLLLERNHVTLADIDLFVFHQASRIVLDSLTTSLRIPPEKVFDNLGAVGNTVSASIPIAVKDAMTSGRWRRGDKIILSGFGVGLSWATALLQV